MGETEVLLFAISWRYGYAEPHGHGCTGQTLLSSPLSHARSRHDAGSGSKSEGVGDSVEFEVAPAPVHSPLSVSWSAGSVPRVSTVL
jgi:hypothetical protein